MPEKELESALPPDPGPDLPVGIREAIAMLEAWAGTLHVQEVTSDGGPAARLRSAISQEQRDIARRRLEDLIAQAVEDSKARTTVGESRRVAEAEAEKGTPG